MNETGGNGVGLMHHVLTHNVVTLRWKNLSTRWPPPPTLSIALDRSPPQFSTQLSIHYIKIATRSNIHHPPRLGVIHVR